MNERLIWLCPAAMILTIATLVEAIFDYRAVRRKADRKLIDMALHCILIESIRLVKVAALSFAVYLCFHKIDINYDTMVMRNWIMASVAWGIGFTSLLDLLFRHRMMRKIRREYTKAK